jgi:hypothetical protein
MPRLNRPPKYRKHKASGQAVVTLGGVDHYLGPHGTKASRREYDRLIGEWLVSGGVTAAADSITVIGAESTGIIAYHAEQLAKAYRDRQARDAIASMVRAVESGHDPIEVLQSAAAVGAVCEGETNGRRILPSRRRFAAFVLSVEEEVGRDSRGFASEISRDAKRLSTRANHLARAVAPARNDHSLGARLGRAKVAVAWRW